MTLAEQSLATLLNLFKHDNIAKAQNASDALLSFSLSHKQCTFPFLQRQRALVAMQVVRSTGQFWLTPK